MLRYTAMKSLADNHLAQSQAAVQRIALVTIIVSLLIFAGILGIYLYRVSNPYIQEVLSLKGDLPRGHAIFKINCAGCHGLEADGNIGPSLHSISTRKSKIDLIEQVISGKTPPMPEFRPNSQDMADLLIYLDSL